MAWHAQQRRELLRQCARSSQKSKAPWATRLFRPPGLLQLRLDIVDPGASRPRKTWRKRVEAWSDPGPAPERARLQLRPGSQGPAFLRPGAGPCRGCPPRSPAREIWHSVGTSELGKGLRRPETFPRPRSTLGGLRVGEPAPPPGPFPRHVVSKAPAGFEKSLWFGSQRKVYRCGRAQRIQDAAATHWRQRRASSGAGMGRKTGLFPETLSDRCAMWQQPTANHRSPLHSQRTETSSRF